MSKLKYYAYISETKIDMLFSQIPPNIRDNLETELKLKLPLAEVAFSKKQIPDNLYTKLNLVTNYIENNGEVGDLEKPLGYFKGILNLGWAQIYPGVIFFGGMKNDTAIGLGGSMNNLLGHEWNSSDVPSGISHTPWLVSLLSKEIEMIYPLANFVKGIHYVDRGVEEDEKRILSATQSWSYTITKHPSDFTFNRFEFLAKTLRYSKFGEQTVLLGTPIFVAHTR